MRRLAAREQGGKKAKREQREGFNTPRTASPLVSCYPVPSQLNGQLAVTEPVCNPEPAMTAEDCLQQDVCPRWRSAQYIAAIKRHGSERPYQTARPRRWLNGVRQGYTNTDTTAAVCSTNTQRAASAAPPSTESNRMPPVASPPRASRPQLLVHQQSAFPVPDYRQQDRRPSLRSRLWPNRHRLWPVFVPHASQVGTATATRAGQAHERPRPADSPRDERGVDVWLAAATRVWQRVCLIWRPACGLPHARHG